MGLSDIVSGTLVDGRFRIIRKIGEGGMASVYEAENTRLGMRVALKLMHFSVSSSESNVQRFLREASALASLNHPNIVRILDVVEHEGAPVLVMELLNGKSLGDLLEAGQRPNANDVFQIASQSLAALQHAHQLGIVHRDIKPDNIFRHVSPTGEATYKLVDFGIARGAEDHSLTSTGQFVGTRRYASPEQIRDPRAVDARTDLYSLGVTLWECVTGETPHAGAETEFSVMRAITETPYFAVSPGRVDEGIGQLIAGLTANDPRQRFASADEAIGFLNGPKASVGFAAPSYSGAFSQDRVSSADRTFPQGTRANGGAFEVPSLGQHSSADVGPQAVATSERQKSKWIAAVLTLFFGPFGLVYVGWKVSGIASLVYIIYYALIAHFFNAGTVIVDHGVGLGWDIFGGVALIVFAITEAKKQDKKRWLAAILAGALGPFGFIYLGWKAFVIALASCIAYYVVVDMIFNVGFFTVDLAMYSSWDTLAGVALIVVALQAVRDHNQGVADNANQAGV